MSRKGASPPFEDFRFFGDEDAFANLAPSQSFNAIL
jgi:hypothetical protein